MTSTDTIRSWLEEGRAQHATHVVIACDTFNWEDYPIYVKKGDDIRKIVTEHDGPNMQKVMEVYNLSKDIEKQLGSKNRVFNY